MPIYTNARPRGFAPWSPTTDTLVILAQIRDILMDELAYWPLTVRQVFYRMVAKKGYPKTEKDYANLAEKINRARRAGLISWDAIRDDKQARRYSSGHWSVSGFQWWVQDHAERLKFHPGLVQLCRIEIHVEAEGMLPQVARVATPAGVDVYSSGGFGSVTVQRDTAMRMAERDVPTVVLSIGDYDPSGVALFQSFKENVLAFFEQGTEHLGTEWGGPGTCQLGIEIGSDEQKEPPLFRRIAVTPEQIRRYGFETAPAKKQDRRGAWDGETVQCEAIPSSLLAEIVRDAIFEHYDEEANLALSKLTKEIRLHVRRAFADIDLSNADEIFQDELSKIRNQHPPDDWTGGYTNEDDDDMEEGV